MPCIEWPFSHSTTSCWTQTPVARPQSGHCHQKTVRQADTRTMALHIIKPHRRGWGLVDQRGRVEWLLAGTSAESRALSKLRTLSVGGWPESLSFSNACPEQAADLCYVPYEYYVHSPKNDTLAAIETLAISPPNSLLRSYRHTDMLQ